MKLFYSENFQILKITKQDFLKKEFKTALSNQNDPSRPATKSLLSPQYEELYYKSTI